MAAQTLSSRSPSDCPSDGCNWKMPSYRESSISSVTDKCAVLQTGPPALRPPGTASKEGPLCRPPHLNLWPKGAWLRHQTSHGMETEHTEQGEQLQQPYPPGFNMPSVMPMAMVQPNGSCCYMVASPRHQMPACCLASPHTVNSPHAMETIL